MTAAVRRRGSRSSAPVDAAYLQALAEDAHPVSRRRIFTHDRRRWHGLKTMASIIFRPSRDKTAVQEGRRRSGRRPDRTRNQGQGRCGDAAQGQILGQGAPRRRAHRGDAARPRHSPRRHQSRAHGSPEWLYDTLYCARGQAENLVKLHNRNLPLIARRVGRRSPIRCGSSCAPAPIG